MPTPKFKIQICSLNNMEPIYKARTSQQVIILPKTTSGESSIVFLDALLDKLTVNIRFISEAQPSLRLQRLLKRGMYDEAELFAKTFGLNVQVQFFFI